MCQVERNTINFIECFFDDADTQDIRTFSFYFQAPAGVETFGVSVCYIRQTNSLLARAAPMKARTFCRGRGG